MKVRSKEFVTLFFGLSNNNDNDKEDKIQKGEGAGDTRKMD